MCHVSPLQRSHEGRDFDALDRASGMPDGHKSMMDRHGLCASRLANVLKAFSDATVLAQANVAHALSALQTTPDTEPKTADQLLEDALVDVKIELTSAQTRLGELDREAWWRTILLKPAARKAKAAAEQAYWTKRDYEMQHEAEQKRRADSELRALTHAAHRACKEKLHQAEEHLTRCERAEVGMKQLCEPLSEAISRKAWLGPDTHHLLKLSVAHSQKHDFRSAAKAIAAVQFQRLPSVEQFKHWAIEYRNVLGSMKLQSTGFAATAAYPGLVKPSLELAKARFHAAAWTDSVERYEDAPDRWHALPACMVTHGALIEPVQWVIYWAFLAGSQRFSVSANQADIHEDVLTGMLTQALKEDLAERAKNRLPQLGYPKAKANFDFLQLAGKKGEFTTGADIGLVIRLDVGNLRVHKVALLQAKVSVDGRADIGSKPSGPSKLTQLQKLGDADRDFFVFYHTTKGSSPSPLPTVTSVKQLRESAKLSSRDLARLSIDTKPREQGWDLASFVAFGLCTPANALGKDVPEDGDPLEAMTDGGRETLPRYMLVVSLSDDAPGYQRIISPLQREGYRAIRLDGRGQALQPSQKKEHDHDGPGHGD